MVKVAFYETTVTFCNMALYIFETKMSPPATQERMANPWGACQEVEHARVKCLVLELGSSSPVIESARF